MTESIKIKRLDKEAKLLARTHPTDAGLDLVSIQEVVLHPNEPVRVPTGISMAIPSGFVGLICDRSSLGAKGIRTLGGVVDAGYRGEVQVILINLQKEKVILPKGHKIAQMLILPVSLVPVIEVSELDQTARAEKGFGSSDAKYQSPDLVTRP